jgi:hypothetical protein
MMSDRETAGPTAIGSDTDGGPRAAGFDDPTDAS